MSPLFEIELEAIKTILISINDQTRAIRKMVDERRSPDEHMKVLGWIHPPDLHAANLRSWHGVTFQVSSWSSPFPLEPELRDQLEGWGLQQHKGEPERLDGGLLLIYRHPASILDHWHHSDARPLRSSALQKGYEQLLQFRAHGHLVADWRLRGVDPDQLMAWLQGGATPLSISSIPDISPLTRVVLLELFRAAPGLEQIYLNLELQAELFGTDAESDLVRRLQHRDDADALLQDWCSSSRAQQGWDHDDERLIRLENDLEHYVLLSREQQRMLKEQNVISDRALQLASRESGADDSA